LIDAGTVWGEDVEAAALRLPALAECQVGWLEEPFVSGAFESYRALAARSDTPLAAGEGAHEPNMARHLIDYAKIGYVQVDTGRIGGIGPAAHVARYAGARGVQFVNHTFTSHLALAASLQPFAGIPAAGLCEYPVESSALARAVTAERLEANPDGEIRLPERPGVGVTVRTDAVREYLLDVEIRVGANVLYRTPRLGP
jgi:L-alanine-DL-glutamate epimerase-like enolase superfamily enzyme